MNNFRSTYNYIFFGICVFCIVILLLALLFVYIGGSNNDTLAQEQSLYKTGFCDGLCTNEKTAAKRTTSYTCKLCFNYFSHKDTNVPKLCETCAGMTGKCPYCGNILINNDEDE